MSDYTASIRQIGMINSGMFDTLSLNFDVKAIHLVGANNVGKTSLIAVIQFLFFPNFKEMTFIKTSGESMGFYFRPEGSYILFEVRTITGNIRTVGIYGTGESDSRVNFVFNGGLDLKEFLSEDNTPKSLQEVQASFFSRDFHRFDKFRRYEEALLGLHTHGEYNVPMFDLSKTNFRLLRKLMQGLLRLDRIDAAEVQDLLVRIVERSAVKTRFNLLQDFEQKYRHINQLRIELRELEALKPVVARYQKIRARITETEEKRKSHAERLFQLSTVYRVRLEGEKETLSREFKDQETRLETLGEQIKARMKYIGDAEATLVEIKSVKERLEALTEISRQYSQPLVRRERDELVHTKVALENALTAARPQNIPDLKRQLTSLERELAGVKRRLEAKTLQQVWIDAGFDEPHRALLSFLVSKNLVSLNVDDCMHDRQAFIDVSQRATSYLDGEGNFKGFGLSVSRSIWFFPEKEQEPLTAQRDRLEENMEKILAEIDVAENQEKKKRELASLIADIQAKDTLLRQFAELDSLAEKWESLENIEVQRVKQENKAKQLSNDVTAMDAENRSLRQAQRQTHSALDAAESRWRQVSLEHDGLEVFESDLPESLEKLTLVALRDEYTLERRELSDIVKSLARYQSDLDEPRAELEARYERSEVDASFEKWLALKTNLSAEITGLEAQLTREYDGIFTVVRAKLSKITQAYENVKAQVAELNKGIRNVRISNIEQIGIALEKTALLDAIDLSVPGQMDLFATRSGSGSLEEAHAIVKDYFEHIKQYGNEINLKDMFRLKFSVKFNHQAQPVERYDIHRFESNGTETGVKIVIYLGLIGLLQERKNVIATRMPFFLDEVGSIDSENLKQLIAYCRRNNFLPIFASPEIRKDISCNYLFRRNGSRSFLENVVKITERKPAIGDT